MALESQFSNFTQLPSELRIKIWKHAFPDPRLVHVQFNYNISQYISNERPPAISHTCSESRLVFLSRYTKLVLCPTYDSAIFIDFERDTLFFDHLDCSPEGDFTVDLAKSPHSDRIRSCAIDAQLWDLLRIFKYDSLNEIRLMPRLRTFALVMSKELTPNLVHDRVDENGIISFLTNVEPSTLAYEPLESQRLEYEKRHTLWQLGNLRWDVQHAFEDDMGDKLSVKLWIL